MEIVIEASVFPTEDPERVMRAILNIFPDAVGKPADGRISMTSAELNTLTRRLAEQKIRDTARAVLLRSVRGNELRFCLNKQAALAGRVNFTECRSVLGDITVSVRTEEPAAEVVRMTGGRSP